MKRTVIVYHGTNAKNARRILRDGFKEGTYFAKHLEDALGYGGQYLFEVVLPVSMIPKNNWQFRFDHFVFSEFIVRLIKYNPSKIMVDNIVLRHTVCASNTPKGEYERLVQDMRENPSQYSKEELIAYGVAKPNSSKL